MGLEVAVGKLAYLIEADPEGAEWLREDLDRANALLSAQSLPTHTERETPLPESSRSSLHGYPYSFLHYLRRIYAHVSRDPSWEPEEVPEGEDPAADPIVEEELTRMRSHLLCHSDTEGFYFPIDFQDVVVDEDDVLPGGMLGSTQRLMHELVVLAPYLGIALQMGELSNSEATRLNRETEKEGPFWIEKCVWLSLFEAARLSLKHGAAICFT